MFELISLFVALFGSSLAAAFDLKITPTEIPDEIPHAMIALALILAFLRSLVELNYTTFLNCLIYGSFLLFFGFLMYKLGQWGGGDAKILAAIGFFSPFLSSYTKNLRFPFALSYLINVFFVGAIYMLVYAFVLAILNKKIVKEFSRSIKASSRAMLISLPVLTLIFFLSNFYLFNFFGLSFEFSSIFLNSVLVSTLCFGFFLLWVFIKSVENVAFKKRIPVSKLKVGDVLLESKVWEGITEKELMSIRKSGKKFVMIKEGVRFAPTFPLALISTLMWGDVISFFFQSILSSFF
jgi:Flp pilus assembly protein protease CpaA